LQGLFRKIFRDKFDEDIRVYLEINDYVHNKNARLFAFIDIEINKAKDT
jgi:predicted RNA-binding protein Jag